MLKEICGILFGVMWVAGMLCGVEANAQVDMLEPTSALYYYSGTIGATEQIEFNLQLKDHGVSGSYIATESGDMFVFSGRMDANRKGIGVLVYDKNNTYIASIEGNLISDENSFAKRIEGKWKSANGRTVRSIKLIKVAEFAQNRPYALPEEWATLGE